MSKLIVYMKKLLGAFKGVKGFTLIELLVVIGILGILAAALIATIDPFEQLKKGRDTTARNTALEYLNALTRYYATHGDFPWGAANACADPTAQPAVTLNAIVGCTTALETEGELKTGFGTSISNSGAGAAIRVYSPANSSTVNVCFSPTAKSIKADAATTYSDSCNAVSASCDTLAERQAAADGVCWQQFR